MNANDSSSTASEADSATEFLARLIRDRDANGDLEKVVRRYQAERPDLAEEIRRLADMQDVLQAAERFDDPTPVPESLGEFRIVRRIDRGGMGEIFEARQESLADRRVALKTIRQGRITPEARQRFLREQRVLAGLHQTHIVPIHTAGEVDELQYFVMPFIDGAALHHVVRAARRETLKAASTVPSLGDLAYQVASAHHKKTNDDAAIDSDGQSFLSHDRSAGRLAEQIDPATVERPMPTKTATTDQEEFSNPDATEYIPRKPRLSIDYFRSVVTVMADVCEAIQHAHEAGYLHRDIKPSNIMVDTQGQSWIIDFGLAGFLNASVREATNQADGDQPQECFKATGMVGTTSYMAPEQFDGRVDVPTDVWGLGVTLFELLTLQRAFVGQSHELIRKKILQTDPVSPRSLIANLPNDLEAICLKAMRKDPAQRYSTPGELAADLRRWLRFEPTVARKARALRRVWLWARRNTGWAVAITVSLIALSATAAGVFVEQARHVAAVQKENDDLRRGTLIRNIELLRQSDPLPVGWSENIKGLVLSAASVRVDSALRDTFASTLDGLDARQVGVIENGIFGSSLAFHAASRQLLLSGVDEAKGHAAQAARRWSIVSQPQSVGLAGPGPVAFTADGTPLQFVRVGPLKYRLYDLKKERRLHELDFPKQDDFEWDDPGYFFNETYFRAMAMSTDAAVVAVGAIRVHSGGEDVNVGAVAVWNVATGDLVQRFPIPATAIALSADGRLLAVGNELGQVSIWSVSTGKRVARLPRQRNIIRCLAFGNNPWILETVSDSPTPLQLAVGLEGGLVSVWDVSSSTLPNQRSTCRGMTYEVFSVAFSPDGTLLSSAGYGWRIWSAASGECLLEVAGNHFRGTAFSQDGKLVAFNSLPWFDAHGQVFLWKLENGRGIRTLRQLGAYTGVVAFSPDGKLVSGLSNNWQLGIWNFETAALIRVLDAPRGFYGDNASIALSPDDTQIVCMTGDSAVLWNVASGKLLRSWPLPRGTIDKLAFDRQGRLIAARKEGTPQNYKCIVRDLLANDWKTPLCEIEDFPEDIFDLRLPIDGSYVVVEGDTAAEGGQRSIRSYDTSNGKQLWLMSLPNKTIDNAHLALDPTGKFLSFSLHNDGERTLVRMPHGEPVGQLEYGETPGPDASLFVSQKPNETTGQAGVMLHRRGENFPLVTFLNGIDAFGCVFDSDGSHIACGRLDGTIGIYDIEQIRLKLAEMGMGW